MGSENVYKRQSVLRAIESGMRPKEAQIAFGISDVATVRSWIREAKQENADLSLCNATAPMAKQPQDKESDEVKALKKALAEAELKAKALDTLIDIAEEQLKVDIRKKSGARQSPK